MFMAGGVESRHARLNCGRASVARWPSERARHSRGSDRPRLQIIPTGIHGQSRPDKRGLESAPEAVRTAGRTTAPDNVTGTSFTPVETATAYLKPGEQVEGLHLTTRRPT